jgi:hypothetical protein
VEQLLRFEVHDGRLEGTYLCFGYCLAFVDSFRGEFTSEGLRLDVTNRGEGPLEFVRIDWRSAP